VGKIFVFIIYLKQIFLDTRKMFWCTAHECPPVATALALKDTPMLSCDMKRKSAAINIQLLSAFVHCARESAALATSYI